MLNPYQHNLYLLNNIYFKCILVWFDTNNHICILNEYQYKLYKVKNIKFT